MIREGSRGFFGIGGEDAIVRVTTHGDSVSGVAAGAPARRGGGGGSPAGTGGGDGERDGRPGRRRRGRRRGGRGGEARDGDDNTREDQLREGRERAREEGGAPDGAPDGAREEGGAGVGAREERSAPPAERRNRQPGRGGDSGDRGGDSGDRGGDSGGRGGDAGGRGGDSGGRGRDSGGRGGNAGGRGRDAGGRGRDSGGRGDRREPRGPAVENPTTVPGAPEDPPLRPSSDAEDEVDFAGRALRDLLLLLGLEDTEIGAREPETPGDGEGRVTQIFDISGMTEDASDELGLLIGRRGETLGSLQYLLNVMVGRNYDDQDMVFGVDVEGYRRRREESLVEMAHRVADEVRETGDVITLEPMPAAERRIIHLALSEEAGVATESVGRGSDRQVEVMPGEPGADDYLSEGEYAEDAGADEAADDAPGADDAEDENAGDEDAEEDTAGER